MFLFCYFNVFDCFKLIKGESIFYLKYIQTMIYLIVIVYSYDTYFNKGLNRNHALRLLMQ